jgi:hypothetical protein
MRAALYRETNSFLLGEDERPVRSGLMVTDVPPSAGAAGLMSSARCRAVLDGFRTGAGRANEKTRQTCLND